MTTESNKNNITSGPIARTIFSLAVPVVMVMVMEFLMITTDYFWVGKLGATAQDAITSSMVVIWTIFVLISVVTVGVTALVSRYVGAKEYDKAGFYIKQGIALALIISTTIFFIGWFLTPSLLKFMDTGENTLSMAIPYLRISFIASIFFFFNDTLYAAFRASGDTKTPTAVGMIAVIFNMGLDPVLIFGLGPFPKMGVPGAALATLISATIAAITIVSLYSKGKLGYKISNIMNIKPIFKEILKIAKIGLPMSSQQLIFVIVYWFLIKYVHTFGEVAGAAMGIGNRMESFSYLTCHGFSVAAATMVGQNLGAKKPERAAKCAWGSARLAVLLTLIISAVLIIFPKYIVSIFTENSDVAIIAIDYLIILGISQSAMAVEIVIEGAFSGAGDTIPVMFVMVPGSLLRIPLAYYLAFTLGWGINGIWWTLTITTLIKASILAFWFYRGKWQLKQL